MPLIFDMRTPFTTVILEPDGYASDAIAAYRSLGRVFLWSGLKSAQKKRALAGADILVVRLNHRITDEWLSRMPSLKIIATPTTGLNHIDLDAAKKRGVKIISLRGAAFLGRTPSTAEETIGLILALVRHIPWAFEDVKKGHWDRDAWRGRQLKDKTLGLLGCGRLGTIVARYGRVFGMNVVGYDPYVGAHAMKRRGMRKVSMTALFKGSDVVSIHVLFGKETENLVDDKRLSLMKPSSVLINTARAEIIKKGALEKALEKKWIAGAAIDVVRDERGVATDLKKDPLWQYAKTHRNLLIVPHIGGATFEAMRETEIWIAKKTVREARRRTATK